MSPKEPCDTFDAVHGGQQLRLFNAHHDEYGFQPIVVFDGGGRIVTAMLRPVKRPKGTEIRAFLRRLLRAIRTNWPRTRILIRADSPACSRIAAKVGPAMPALRSFAPADRDATIAAPR